MTQIVDGNKREMRLCTNCAGQGAAETGLSWPGPSFHKLLGGLLGSEGAFGGLAATHGGAGLRCPNCGLTYGDFRRLGHLGCSECYATFAEPLDPMLRRIQGSTVHAGKIPVKAAGALKKRRQRERLEQELQELIEKEAYEQAAVIRDKLRALDTADDNGQPDDRARGQGGSGDDWRTFGDTKGQGR